MNPILLCLGAFRRAAAPAAAVVRPVRRVGRAVRRAGRAAASKGGLVPLLACIGAGGALVPLLSGSAAPGRPATPTAARAPGPYGAVGPAGGPGRVGVLPQGAPLLSSDDALPSALALSGGAGAPRSMLPERPLLDVPPAGPDSLPDRPVAEIPEPSSVALFGVALLALIGFGWRASLFGQSVRQGTARHGRDTL